MSRPLGGPHSQPFVLLGSGEAGADWGRLAHGRALETLSLCLPPQGRYDEEIEVYRHHLEQMYKLCRPCQAAVEHYIKHQNRQLRALLLSHQFRRREADQTHAQVRGASMGHSRHPSPGVCAGNPFPEGWASDWGAALQS